MPSDCAQSGSVALNSGNYDLSYQGNNLTITKALLNVIADAKTKVYGDADPSLTYQVSGLKNGDTAALPDWAQSLGMVMSLILLAPSWGGMINGMMTLSGAWHKLRSDPILRFLVVSHRAGLQRRADGALRAAGERYPERHQEPFEQGRHAGQLQRDPHGGQEGRRAVVSRRITASGYSPYGDMSRAG